MQIIINRDTSIVLTFSVEYMSHDASMNKMVAPQSFPLKRRCYDTVITE